MRSLILLKLGGSLITDKQSPRSPRIAVIQRIAQEIANAQKKNPDQKIVLGHGSGSFGHYSAQKHHTLDGVKTPEDWQGFAQVWFDAFSLNQIVMEALHSAGVQALSFPPSTAVITQDQKISIWNLKPLQLTLDKGLVPVVYGDVAFDEIRGGTILSTEDLFVHLAHQFDPQQILLAGQDPGVWEDFPECTSLLKEITPADLPDLQKKIQGSGAPDVTGGMENKVNQMLQLIKDRPHLEAIIFSGEEPGAIESVLQGEPRGTLLHH
jgi:isopentenyl phosphate kinase